MSNPTKLIAEALDSGLTRSEMKDMLRRLMGGTFHWTHKRDGEVVEQWDSKNIVTDEGLDYLLDAGLAGGTQITTWFIALKDDTGDPVDGSETYATPVFTEIENYDEAARPAWTAGTVSSQSVDNSGSAASFTISATVTVHGAALMSDNTKGDTATAGAVMYAVSNFSSSKALVDNDTLEVTYTFTMADDGS